MRLPNVVARGQPPDGRLHELGHLAESLSIGYGITDVYVQELHGEVFALFVLAHCRLPYLVLLDITRCFCSSPLP